MDSSATTRHQGNYDEILTTAIMVDSNSQVGVKVRLGNGIVMMTTAIIAPPWQVKRSVHG